MNDVQAPSRRSLVFAFLLSAPLALVPLDALANSGTSALLFRPFVGLFLLGPVIGIEGFYYKHQGIEGPWRKSGELNFYSYIAGALLSIAAFVVEPEALWVVPAGPAPVHANTPEKVAQTVRALRIAFLLNFGISVFIEGSIAKLAGNRFAGIRWRHILIVHLFSYGLLGFALFSQYGK